MYIEDSVLSLTTMEAHGQIHSSTVSEVLSKLLMLEAYPQNLVIPGEAEFTIMRMRYGESVVNMLMKHLCESLASRRAITDFAYMTELPMAAAQDPYVQNVMYTMFFRTWTDLRKQNIECFPYEYARAGKSNALFTQLRGERLLEFAGI